MRVEFKFWEAVPSDQRKRVVDEVAQIGVQKAEPLFPGEQDPELASMYKIEDVPDTLVDSLISSLEASDAVEFAERTPERRLIR